MLSRSAATTALPRLGGRALSTATPSIPLNKSFSSLPQRKYEPHEDIDRLTKLMTEAAREVEPDVAASSIRPQGIPKHLVLTTDLEKEMTIEQWHEYVRVALANDSLSYGMVLNHFISKGVPLTRNVRRKLMTVLYAKDV